MAQWKEQVHKTVYKNFIQYGAVARIGIVDLKFTGTKHIMSETDCGIMSL